MSHKTFAAALTYLHEQETLDNKWVFWYIQGVGVWHDNLIFRVIRTPDVTACGASELCDV